jgi:hypothetical protein
LSVTNINIGRDVSNKTKLIDEWSEVDSKFQSQGQEPTPTGWAPWATRQRMRTLVAGGFVLSVLLIGSGVYQLTEGKHAVPITAFGCIMFIFFAVAIPVGRKLGKL